MSVGTLARYATMSGESLSVKVVANGRDKYGAATVVKVTGTPKGSAYRRGDVLTVSSDTRALSTR